MGYRLIPVAALAAVMLHAPFAAAREMVLPDGVVTNVYDTGAQNWPLLAKLAVRPPTVHEWHAQALAAERSVADDAAMQGRAIPLSRGQSLAWKASFAKPSTYQVAVYARAEADRNPVRDRTFMSVQVGDAKPIVMQVNFRERYAAMARFTFHVDAPGERTITLSIAGHSQPVQFHIERIRLIDQFGDCAGAAGKTKQVLWTPEEVARIRAATQTKPAPARTTEQWREFYEACWNMPPSPYLPMVQPNYQLPANNPRTGKPAKWDNYDLNRKLPRNQVLDAVTKEVFPNADFPDDGWGWISEADRLAGNWGNTYFFTAWHANAGHVYQQGVDSWPNLASRIEQACRRYHETSDPGHGREAAVMFAAFARQFPLIDYDVVDLAYGNVHTDKRWAVFTKGGGWLYNSHQNAAMARLAVAYDQLFPFLYPQAPSDVVEFIAEKVPTVKTGDDLRAMIETNVVQFSAASAIRRQYLGANGLWESCLATHAAVQQNPKIVKPWLDALWTRAYLSVNEGGLPDLITNLTLREGSNLIGQLNYAMDMRRLAEVAVMLKKLRDAGGPEGYDLTDTQRYPKLLAACLFPLDIRAAGGFQSHMGEGYNQPEMHIRTYPEAADRQARMAYAFAYEQTGDPRCAWFLREIGREGETDELWSRIERDAAACGDAYLHSKTRQLPGVGIAALESGSEETSLERKAGLMMLSSIRAGHAHADTLDIELFARGARISPDLAMRYEPVAYMTRGHNLVEVDDADFVNVSAGRPSGTGWIDVLNEGGWIRFTQGSARAALRPQVKLYRRAAALVDTPDGAYFVDVMRVKGGKKHTWSFHTQYAEAFSTNAQPSPENAAMKAYVNRVKGLAPASYGTASDVLVTEYKVARGIARDVAGPIHVRSHLFDVSGLPMVVAEPDKSSKLFSEKTPLHFVHVRSEGKDLATRWLHLIEPYGNAPIIRQAESLAVDAPADAAALRVTLASGRVDTLIYNDTGGRIQAGGIATDGLFACVSRGADGARAGAYLVGGSELAFDGWVLKTRAPALDATIKAFDPLTNTLTLDQPWPNDHSLAGLALTVGPPERMQSYEVLTHDGATLQLKGTAHTYQSPVVSVEGKRVRTELQMVMKTADPAYYVGMRATNAGRDRWWRVAGTPRDEAVLKQWEGKALPTDVRYDLDKMVKLDTEVSMDDFPEESGRRMIHLYDFGPGDKVRMPAAISIRAGAGGALTATTNVAFGLTDASGKPAAVGIAGRAE